MTEEEDIKRKAEMERATLREWLRKNSVEAARRDLLDAAPESDRGTASATQIEAIDRAAHSEAAQARKALYAEEEARLFKEMKRDLAEIYPTPEAWEHSLPVLQPPNDPEQRMQYDDFEQMRKERNVTPEQKTRVDDALSNISISKDISGASDVTGKPAPNEPTPMDKALEVGQDLYKAGLTVEKE